MIIGQEIIFMKAKKTIMDIDQENISIRTIKVRKNCYASMSRKTLLTIAQGILGSKKTILDTAQDHTSIKALKVNKNVYASVPKESLRFFFYFTAASVVPYGSC